MAEHSENYAYTTPPPGYRLPAELRLGPIKLQVASLAISIEYYERVIGLSVLDRTAGRAQLGVRSTRTVLLDLAEKPGATPVPRRGKLGLYHFAILLPDRSSLARFLIHLTELGEYAGMSDHFVSEALYLTDPDGLGIEVYADRARTSWERNESNLAMGSAHLNVHELLRSAGDEKWNGVPTGAEIGHVHLYVDNLGKAERFYHSAIGFDKVRLDFPSALFMSGGGYHHHLGTNTWAAHAPPATDADARLIEWTVIFPMETGLAQLAASLKSNGFTADSDSDDLVTVDPWGIRVRFKIAA